MRKSWDEYFIDIAYQVATRASCPVKSVGAVFVNSETKAIVTQGFNGASRGEDHCSQCDGRKLGENKGVCKAIHAEANAIANAALNGVMLKNTDAYLTISPCYPCSQLLNQVGVRRVIYDELYKDSVEQSKLFQKRGIKFGRLTRESDFDC